MAALSGFCKKQEGKFPKTVLGLSQLLLRGTVTIGGMGGGIYDRKAAFYSFCQNNW